MGCEAGVKMAAIPTPDSPTVSAIYGWRERMTENGHREHLGASLIGHECARHLWYVFRWAGREAFSGRMLRMFDTGKREEARVYAELRGIGCEVWADDGTGQYRVSAVGGHFGGSMDGVVQGIPEAPKAPHVLEIKTHAAKSHADVAKKGVQASKPMHWTQMQTYMHLAGIDRALYFATNKDTDAIYTERVRYDKDTGERIIAKAEAIIRATEPPIRLSDDPEYFSCRWCSHASICHGTDVPEVNCRTCAYSTPSEATGKWVCEAGKAGIQRPGEAHQCHRYTPPLLARLGTPEDADEESVTYRTPEGAQFSNGPRPGFSSIEIHRSKDKRVFTDPTVVEALATFDTAQVVG